MLIYLRGIKRIASMTFILNKGKEIEIIKVCKMKTFIIFAYENPCKENDFILHQKISTC